MSDVSERKVWEHDWAIKALTEGQMRGNAETEDVKRDVNEVKKRMTEIERSFGEFVAVAKAIENKSVTTKTFVLGLGGFFIALVTLVISALAATGAFG